jgi:hypothetical protein
MVRLFTAKSFGLISLATFSLCIRDAKLVPDQFLKREKAGFSREKKFAELSLRAAREPP